MNSGVYKRLNVNITGDDRFAMMFAAYNGGIGGVLSDIKVCESTSGCDPYKWFDNVEKTSLKAKTKVTGYGKSFFDINREYPRNIMFLRNRHYQELIKY
jgi:membrane-bound lytic murein transglycosylase MltF